MTTLLARPDAIRPDAVAGPMPFTATSFAAGHVRLEGELDISGLDALRSVLEQALVGSDDVVVDVAGLTFIDSRAISELLRFQLVAAAQSREVLLLRPSPAVARVIDILELGHILMATDGVQ